MVCVILTLDYQPPKHRWYPEYKIAFRKKKLHSEEENKSLEIQKISMANFKGKINFGFKGCSLIIITQSSLSPREAALGGQEGLFVLFVELK